MDSKDNIYNKKIIKIFEKEFSLPNIFECALKENFWS